MMQQERDDAMAQTTWLDRQRFRPQQWSSWNRWRVYRAGSTDRWFGFECVRELTGLPPEILLVPLPGHTFGHAGVAVRTSDRWLLQAGDAYFYHREMSATDPWCTPGLRLYQTLMEMDRGARLANQERLRRLRHVHGGELELFCSHDPIEFERMTGQSIRVPFAADVPARHHHAGAGAGAHAN
jgi:glyoxylase-like metal-dependent hydrolase (beta-lactamase superfamily II)